MADRLPERRLRFELRELALVGIGAVPGALLRWQSGVQLGPHLGGSAGANLLVNLVGSFLLGFLAGPDSPPHQPAAAARALAFAAASPPSAAGCSMWPR